VTTTTGGGNALVGNAPNGATANGVRGISATGIGVRGLTTSGTGVSGETTGSGFGVKGIASGNGYGVYGSGGYTGAYGSGGSYGGIFYGNNSGAYGVYASGNSTGVYAIGNTNGVYAIGSSYGVRSSSSSVAVYGSGSGYGLYGSASVGVYGSGTSYGLYGYTSNPKSSAVQGTYGQYAVRGSSGRTAGVRGDSGYVGVWAEAPVYGVNAVATATSGQSFGIYTQAASAGDPFAMYANGRVHVNGTLSKAAGSFKIDHPLEPERKWLQHSFVESPDMMNVYNGNVTTDAAGLAIVDLPAYFDALNSDFRYQLTVVGTMAQAIVDREIQKNQFRIRTSKGRVKVSWQVTGIRQDAYARSHRIKVEMLKRRAEQGTRQFVPNGVRGRVMNYAPSASEHQTASLPELPELPDLQELPKSPR
jgi:hypothetical protein